MTLSKNHILFVSVLAFLALALGGCQTVEGAGQDIENAGEAVEDTARDWND